MTELLPKKVSIPSIAIVASYFKIIEQGGIPRKSNSPLINKLGLKSFFLDMQAKGITVQEYYCTYIQDKYSISRTYFYKHMTKSW